MQTAHSRAWEIQARKARRPLSTDAVEVIRSIAYQQVVDSSAIEGKHPIRHDEQVVWSADESAQADGENYFR